MCQNCIHPLACLYCGTALSLNSAPFDIIALESEAFLHNTSGDICIIASAALLSIQYTQN